MPAERRVAVIGSGVAGLSAAWLLSRAMRVVLYEAQPRLGGHSNTGRVPGPGGAVPVDTGFIVYNERNYPNLVALFAALGVATAPSDMSFAASLDGGRLEYSGTSLNGLLGQRRNVLRPRFWTMLRDVRRFYREAPRVLADAEAGRLSLGDWLAEQAYSDAFVEDHLLPMGAAIWSTTARQMRDYPVQAFVRFFHSHGLLTLTDRPQWRTVQGGSIEYVRRIQALISEGVRSGSAVARVEKVGEMLRVIDRRGNQDLFTDVVIATHADEALAMLAEPAMPARSLLSAFRYTENLALLHSDATLMPQRRRVWSSWNYIGEPVTGAADTDPALCVTYWMNRLQGLQTTKPIFVTLNPSRPVASERMHGCYRYTHPLFNDAALDAQRRLWQMQGDGNIWFCGAYFGSGFHEDALQSGLAAAEALAAAAGIGGLRRPWHVPDENGRIFVAPSAPLSGSSREPKGVAA